MLINITQINPKLLTVYINGICQTTIKTFKAPTSAGGLVCS